MSDELKNHLKELGDVSVKIFNDIKQNITDYINSRKEASGEKKPEVKQTAEAKPAQQKEVKRDVKKETKTQKDENK